MTKVLTLILALVVLAACEPEPCCDTTVDDRYRVIQYPDSVIIEVYEPTQITIRGSEQ